jgi:hypothetical protein
MLIGRQSLGIIHLLQVAVALAVMTVRPVRRSNRAITR